MSSAGPSTMMTSSYMADDVSPTKGDSSPTAATGAGGDSPASAMAAAASTQATALPQKSFSRSTP